MNAPIETPRLILRPMRAEDATPLHELFGDAAFMDAFDERPFDMDQTVAWVRRNLEHQRQHGFGLFTVVLRETGEVIGDCGFERIELGGQPATELGYDIVRRLWGRGLATEAARAAAAFGASALHVERLVSLIRVGNHRSERVARKIGMAPIERVERNGIVYDVFAHAGLGGSSFTVGNDVGANGAGVS